MDTWREIHLFNKKSVEIYNPHASNRKTYHADVKKSSGFGLPTVMCKGLPNVLTQCQPISSDSTTPHKTFMLKYLQLSPRLCHLVATGSLRRQSGEQHGRRGTGGRRSRGGGSQAPDPEWYWPGQ